MFLIILFYILSWIHFVYRIKTGGKTGELDPGPYGCDERCFKADFISGMTVVWGTVLLVIYIF